MAGRTRPLLLVIPLFLIAGRFAYSAAHRLAGDDLSAGRAAVVAGDWPAVATHADRLDRVGHSDAARLLRGAALVDKGRTRTGLHQSSALQAALAQLSRIRDARFTDEATVLAAECLVRLGDRPLAEGALQTVVRRAADRPDAHRWLAAIYVDLNAPISAARHLDEWGRLDPSSGWPLRWAGFFWKSAGESEPAARAYRAALDRKLDDPARADAARELAEVLLDWQQDYAGVLATIDRSPEAARGKPAFLVLRATALWGLGRHDEAIAVADRAIREAPDAPAALQLRSQFHLNRDAPAAARPLLERAAALAPHDLGVLKDLADACEQAGDRAAAAGHRTRLGQVTALRERMTRLSEAAQRRPWDSAPRREAAQVCRELGRPDEARMWAKAAVTCDPADRSSRELLEGLGESTPGPRPDLLPSPPRTGLPR